MSRYVNYTVDTEVDVEVDLKEVAQEYLPELLKDYAAISLKEADIINILKKVKSSDILKFERILNELNRLKEDQL